MGRGQDVVDDAYHTRGDWAEHAVRLITWFMNLLGWIMAAARYLVSVDGVVHE